MLNISESNNLIVDLIRSKKPFFISRLGIGAETYATYDLFKNRTIKSPQFALSNNAGIYHRDNDDIVRFCYSYYEALKSSKILARFPNSIQTEQDYFVNELGMEEIHNRSLEPYYVLQEKETPWTWSLQNKRVLIISPFIDSFKKQLKNGFEIIEGVKMFCEDQRFVWYKPYNTSAGNHIHSNWEETFEIMERDILELDFDVALVSCGGYGLPICKSIRDSNRSAIYIGGGLQLLFGVLGSRWESNEMFQTQAWIRPSKEELPPHPERVEGGCYS
tara:strand:- start:707 stop:1531 length:825 start_codon:yes stop_codon:yes gene_type:complete